jgi:hypothetical protein
MEPLARCLEKKHILSEYSKQIRVCSLATQAKTAAVHESTQLKRPAPVTNAIPPRTAALQVHSFLKAASADCPTLEST